MIEVEIDLGLSCRSQQDIHARSRRRLPKYRTGTNGSKGGFPSRFVSSSPSVLRGVGEPLKRANRALIEIAPSTQWLATRRFLPNRRRCRGRDFLPKASPTGCEDAKRFVGHVLAFDVMMYVLQVHLVVAARPAGRAQMCAGGAAFRISTSGPARQRLVLARQKKDLPARGDSEIEDGQFAAGERGEGACATPSPALRPRAGDAHARCGSSSGIQAIWFARFVD